MRHLEPEELVMVRSIDGVTELRPLDEPIELRKLLKRSPEAFLSRRIVINEGKTEYGMILEHLDQWNFGVNAESVPSAALGVVAIEGNGGTGSADWAEQLLHAGYEIVLFVDSDDDVANRRLPAVEAAGGTVVQWRGEHSTETAICSQLDASGLTAFIKAALEVADDPEGATQSYAHRLVVKGAPATSTGADPLDVTTWAAAEVDLDAARRIVGSVAKDKSWFKRVDKGRRLGRFILDTPALQTGEVKATLDELRAAIYGRTGALVAGDPERARG